MAVGWVLHPHSNTVYNWAAILNNSFHLVIHSPHYDTLIETLTGWGQYPRFREHLNQNVLFAGTPTKSTFGFILGPCTGAVGP